jgi:DNA-binding transcriptional LysR family regulator
VETEHLKEFVTLAKCGSFTNAARELHLTQSALSKHIAALERDFDVDLFVRDRVGVKLTRAGDAFLKSALQIDRLLAQTRTMLPQVEGGERPSNKTLSLAPAGSDLALRCAVARIARRCGLTAQETGALILYLEERGFGAIRDEFDLSRDEVADLLAGVYRKLGVSNKQEALSFVHSVLE